MLLLLAVTSTTVAGIGAANSMQGVGAANSMQGVGDDDTVFIHSTLELK